MHACVHAHTHAHTHTHTRTRGMPVYTYTSAYVIFLHACTHGELWFIVVPKGLLYSAQDSTLEKARGRWSICLVTTLNCAQLWLSRLLLLLTLVVHHWLSLCFVDCPLSHWHSVAGHSEACTTVCYGCPFITSQWCFCARHLRSQQLSVLWLSVGNWTICHTAHIWVTGLSGAMQ